MKKIIVYSLIALILLTSGGFLAPNTTHAAIDCSTLISSPVLYATCVALGGDATGIGTKGASLAASILLDPAAELFLRLSGTILWLGGAALNGAVHLSVVQMSRIVNDMNAIDAVWKTIRDLANMTFIFILLYIAISTILGSGDKMKNLLKNVIIVALLINFSLFFTKVVIDASNIIALQFYKPFTASEEVIEEENIVLPGWDRGISNVFMNALKISTVYNVENPDDPIKSGALLGELAENANKSMIVKFGGGILFLILAFIFFSAALMFFIRFAILIILMMLSPIAFVGMILPKLGAQSQKWLKTLVDQAFFAPAFMIMIYVVAKVISSGPINSLGEGKTYASLFSGAEGSLELLANFVIVCGLAVMALVISKSFMSGAAKGIVDWSTKTAGRAAFGTAGWAGRRSLGRLGHMMAEDDTLKETAESRGFGGLVARGLIGVGDRARTSSYDWRGTKLGGKTIGSKAPKGGYKKILEEREKREEGYKEGAKQARASRDAVEAAERTYIEEKVGGLRHHMDTLERGDRVFLGNEVFEGEKGKERMREILREEENKARSEFRKRSTEERMQNAAQTLSGEDRGKATKLSQDLEKAMKDMISGAKGGAEAYNKIKSQIYDENDSIKEYVFARQEMNEKDRAYGIGLARAEREYGERYAAATFFGFSDEARRSVAQKARKGKTPKDDFWEAIQKGIKSGDLKIPGSKTGDAETEESSTEENEESGS